VRFGHGADFTDDSVCTIAVADALLHGSDPAQVLHEWCGGYPGRGYGGMFASWLATTARTVHPRGNLETTSRDDRDPPKDVQNG
jgi:ADP-ribosyl-[dinitrogen reductase] hydrolase